MHSYLKWVIYAAIAIFFLAFGYVIIAGISIELRSLNDAKNEQMDSVAYDFKCAQDSIISSLEMSAEKLDSIAAVVHQVESTSKKADVGLMRRYEKAIRTIDSLKSNL